MRINIFGIYSGRLSLLLTDCCWFRSSFNLPKTTPSRVTKEQKEVELEDINDDDEIGSVSVSTATAVTMQTSCNNNNNTTHLICKYSLELISNKSPAF